MQKTKTKRESHLSGKRWPFVGMSILIAIIVTLLSAAFVATNPANYLTTQQIFLASLLLNLSTTVLQVGLIERYLKRSMRGWLAYTMMGTATTLLILSQLNTSSPDFGLIQLMLTLTFMVPISLFQTVWLWQRFRQAWLFPIMVVFNAVVLPPLSIFIGAGTSFPGRIIFAALTAILPALLMYYILSQPKPTEKLKNEFASDEDEARVHRLQERDISTPLWDIGDDQALQREA